MEEWRDEGRLACRGVRGAISVGRDEELEPLVGELLAAMLEGSGGTPEDVAAVVFSVQDDLAGLNPAAAARRRGYSLVPLLVVREHGGDTALPRCLRALMLVNTRTPQAGIRHAYLGVASSLRPDLSPGWGIRP
ncbi:MAG: chorismate mutase [Candidatus Dormibacteraeota bacterium]|nr:chorismate mutase [Candidatus Dormibacteraeota bacterium]